jgi:malonyl-CoA O-methyltransferase
MLAVQRSFDRAADSYRQAAGVQAEIATKLAAMISVDSCDTALEIGCGDGLFTEKLVDRVAINSLITLDLAHNLLARLPGHIRTLPVQANGEQLPIRSGSVDLLTSSSCLQWFNNPHKSLPELLTCLKDSGSFYFSVFCHGTFAEMSQINQQCGFGQVRFLPKEQQIQRILEDACGGQVQMQSETIIRTYPDVMTFLKRQKDTGAGHTENKKFTGRRALQKFIKAYEKQFATENGIKVSYRIAYYQGIYSGR